MKQVKKLAGVMLALVMALALMVPAFAANNTDYHININGKAGETYTAYQIFDVTYGTQNGAATNYVYTIDSNSGWYGFVSGQGEGAAHVKLTPMAGSTTTFIVEWQGDTQDSVVAQFAKDALEYAKTHTVPTGVSATAPADGDGKVTITVASPGYYLVDSSLGALCHLDTTRPDASIEEKNDKPQVDKKVVEDSNNTAGKENDADIGQVVNFETTITYQPGNSQFVLHDAMSAGLTFDPDSVKVNGNALTDAVGTLKTEGFVDDCTFEIAFAETFFDNMAAGTTVVVTYSATVNENAVVGDAGNENKTILDYFNGDSTESTPESKTTTCTYGFSVVKTDENKALLEGAEFKLYADEEKTQEVYLTKGTDGVYRPAAQGATSGDVIVAGNVKIEGLDSGTYYLSEETAPDGFNKVDTAIPVTIGKGIDLTTVELDEAGTAWVSGGIQVENKSGSLLPSTGGIGTTIFYIGGGVLVVAAVVLLITKRRANVDDE